MTRVTGLDYFKMAAGAQVSDRPHDCPVCGQTEFPEGGSYDICEICVWEDDPVQLEKPALAGGANTLSLVEAREHWAKQKRRLP